MQREVMFLQKTQICPNPIAYPLHSLRTTAGKANVCSKHRVPPDSGLQVTTRVMAKQNFLSGNFYKYRQVLLEVWGR